MDLPGLLVAWFAGYEQGSSAVQLELHHGPANHDKRSAWLGAESTRALGSFVVWNSGEVEVEVLDARSEVRTHVVSTVVTSEEELDAQIALFVESCQG